MHVASGIFINLIWCFQMDMKLVSSLSESRQKKLEKTFTELVAWIDLHLDEQIGWAELMAQSGLDHQMLQMLFFKFKATTPMTWIRHQRQEKKHQAVAVRLSLMKN